MMRQQRHAAGTFPVCPTCDREPRHMLDLRRRPLGGHLLSCACGDSPKHDSLMQAAEGWCTSRGLVFNGPRRGNVLRLPQSQRQQVSR